MIHRIAEYALRTGLDSEPGFAPKRARYAIACSPSGDYEGIQELGNAGEKKNPGREFSKCPTLTQPEMKAGGVHKSHFLLESAGVIAGMGDEAATKKGVAKHAFFWDLIRRAAHDVLDLAGLGRLADPETIGRIRSDLDARGVKPTDSLTFQLGSTFPLDSSAWHEWWRDFRNGLPVSKAVSRKRTGNLARMRCFLTGDLVEPASTHEKILGLGPVGGLGAMGDVLIGFKQDSFCSYGLSQSANAAMSELTAKRYQSGLNDLIARHRRILAGMMVTYWFKSAVPPEDDLLAMLADPAQDERDALRRATTLLEAVRKGQRPDLAGNEYYALSLSGASGRVMVRDWNEGPFDQLAAQVARWFSDLSITALTGVTPMRDPGLFNLLTCLLPERKPSQKMDDWLKPLGAVRQALWDAAIQGRPLPTEAMTRALLMHRAFCLRGDLDELLNSQKDNGQHLTVLYHRMALLKTYHLRRPTGGTSMNDATQIYLNVDHPSPAYHCGRMMAVLAQLQRDSLGEVGANVIQRYYAAASATPGLVFGRLVRNAQFHIDKLASQKPWLANRFTERMAEISSCIGNLMPSTLSLEEQSLFALGFYQQIAQLRAERRKSESSPEASTQEVQ